MPPCRLQVMTLPSVMSSDRRPTETVGMTPFHSAPYDWGGRSIFAPSSLKKLQEITALRVSRSFTLPRFSAPSSLPPLAQRRPYSVIKKARESGLSFFRSVFARLFRSPDGATDRGARTADALRKGFYGRCCMFCSVGFPLFQ